MKHLVAAVLILSVCGARGQQDCISSDANIAAIVALAPDCSPVDVNVLSGTEPDLSVVCGLPVDNACREGLNRIFTGCGLPINDNFCSNLPTFGPATAATPTDTLDPIGQCFQSRTNEVANLFSTCMVEGINVQSGSPQEACGLSEDSPCRTGFVSLFTACSQSFSSFCANLPTGVPPTGPVVDPLEACFFSSDNFDAVRPILPICQEEGFDLTSRLQTNRTSLCLLEPDGACRSVVFTVLNNCGVPMSELCSGPTSTGGPMTPTPDCLSQDSTQAAFLQLLGTCQNEIEINITDSNNMNPEDIFGQVCSLSQGSSCRSGITRIFYDCRVSFDALCIFESLPTPSPTQQECLTRAEQDRAADLLRECGGVQMNSFAEIQALCAREGCRNLLQSVFVDGCGYTAVNNVCDSLLTISLPTDGTVNHYAAPLVVLIAALMSVLF